MNMLIKKQQHIPKEIMDFFEIPPLAIEFVITVKVGEPILVTITKYIEQKEDL
jgi:hypothetical protein